ncbi:MAG: MauE/DoxX family redox-associated membrane protein [Ferruginibacter sp.]
MKHNLFIGIPRFLIIILFIYTGISKLLNIQSTYTQLLQVGFLKTFAYSLAIGLPVLEIIAALALVFTKTQIIGSWAASRLMVGFICYIAIVLFMDSNLRPCTCGGVIAFMSWRQHLVFNLVFLALAFISIVNSCRNKVFSTDKKGVS